MQKECGNEMSSKIEWTDKTANPIKRVDGGNYCEKISPGCANCFASALNSKGTRFGGNGKHFGGANQERPEMTLNVDMLQSWGRMRKEHKIFVGSMTDIFGEWVPEWMIFALLDAMAAAPRQTFQVLTKRPQRASEIIENWLLYTRQARLPKNVWLGVSTEDQQRLDERLIWLIRSYAKVSFLSLEPLLGPVLLPDCDSETALMMQKDNPAQILEPLDYIDWVIIGGESGPKARPMNLVWVEDILAQCRAANIPAFVKQLGEDWGKEVKANHRKGGDPDEWPQPLKVRMMPGEAW
jgi:protein gp37